MAVAVCKFVGARHVVVTDVNDYRLELAMRCGATRAINVSSGDGITKIKQVNRKHDDSNFSYKDE